jgi:hypothetical protein
MTSQQTGELQLEFHPATAEHWPDLEVLSGERGERTVEGYPVEVRQAKLPGFRLPRLRTSAQTRAGAGHI